MEKDNVNESKSLDEWYVSLSPEEKEQVFNGVQDKRLKCTDPNKRSHLRMSWKPELSDNSTLFKYEESESGLYYECPNILEYIQDCRHRKNRVASEVIRDFELIHKNNKQKLFLWVSELFEHIINVFSDALTDFLATKSTKRVSISTDKFEDRYIILTNIIVDNYDQKVEILNEFKSTLTPELAAPLAVYFDNKPEPYERIPSIANPSYLNTATIDLVNKGYRMDATLAQQVKDIIASHVSDGKYINIIINIGCTFNNYGTEPMSDYAKFVEYIMLNKPDWYKPGEWISKSILVEKFNEQYKSDISSQVFSRRMHAEKLMEHISEGEKRARVNGKRQRLFLAKNFH